MPTRIGIMLAVAIAPQRLFSRIYDVPEYRQLLNDWIDGLNLASGAEIAELGCGPGRLAMDLAERGYRLTGVDSSRRMIQLAQRVPRAKCRFVLADAYALPFADPAFDATISASLINVVPDPHRLIWSMARITKPNGVVSCLFPGPNMHLNASQKVSQGFLDRELMHTWASVSRKVEPEAVCDVMQAAGLKEVRLQSFWSNSVHAVSANCPAG